jgi:hypothetical protein
MHSAISSTLTHAFSVRRQTRLEAATRGYLWSKAQQLSGLKRKADAAAVAVIPLSTPRGGHPLHVQILPNASSKPLEELSGRQKQRRRLSADLHQSIVQAPLPPIPPPLAKLSPRECLTFAQLSGQQIHRALRAMRSFLNGKGLNFLCSDNKLRAAEKELQLPLHIHTSEPIAFRVADITTPLALLLQELHCRHQLAVDPLFRGSLAVQLQVDKGAKVTRGLLKVINVQGAVLQKNLLPIFHYVGDENHDTISALMKPLISQLEEFAFPSALDGCFSSTMKVFSSDIKAMQTILGLSQSACSTFPCPHCLIPLTQLRSLAGVTEEYQLRNSLQHGADHLDLQMDHNGDISFAKDYHNCIHSPPFIYGLPAMQRNVVVGMPVLHISIGLGTKLLKLVRSFAADKEAFTQLLTQHNLNFYLYHGETMNGPQVHRLLSGEKPLYLTVLEAIKDVVLREQFYRHSKLVISQSKPYSHLLELFQLFAGCYKLYTADRYLSLDEIASLSQQCRSFGTKFYQYFPRESITLKMHMLAVDIPRFARTHGTVGLYNEQAVESMHAGANQLLRDYAGVGENMKKHQLVFQALYRKHCPSIPSFEPPRRLCSVCDLPLAHNKDIHTACQLIRRHK